MKKKTGYILFMLNILVVWLIDIWLISVDVYYQLKFNIIDLICGLAVGFSVYLLNIYALKLQNYFTHKSNTNVQVYQSKSSILRLMKVFPDKIGFIDIIICIGAVALLEELIFRKYLLGFLINNAWFNTICTIIIVSLLYALYHLNLKKTIPLIILGIAFTGLVVYTNNLFPAVIAHFTNNFIMLLKYKFIKK